jgi:hypothetical protein
MYYSSAPTPQSFFDKGIIASSAPQRSRRKWQPWIATIAVVAMVMGGGYWSWGQARIDKPEILGQSSVAATPQPTVGRTFGDLLKEKTSYIGWLAGVDNGSIVLMQPQNGSLNRLVDAPNNWYGPISTMSWSPDHSTLAYLTLPMDDAAALTKDAAGYAAKRKLNGIPTPASFPYGRLTILDVATKQAFQTNVEVRNTPKPLVWMDGTTLAAIGQTVVRYNLTDGTSATLVGGGNTSAADQLQTPLAWDMAKQVLYFTKVKQTDNGQTVRMAVALHVQTNQLEELQPLKTGAFDDVTTSLGIDLALSADGARLAELGSQGLTYVTVADGGVHSLPYNDTWVWLQHSTLSNVQWLSPDKIGFVSMDERGAKVWGVWNIPTDKVVSFGRGSLSGSWDVASSRLALIESLGKAVDIITPNWDDASASQLQSWPLNWSDVSW